MTNLQLKKLTKKGENVLIMGATSGGKTTMINSISPNLAISPILDKRCGDSKTTTKLTKVIFSDYLDPVNDKNVVYITGYLKNVTQFSLLDNNELIKTVLFNSLNYFYTNNSRNSIDIEKLKEQIRVNLSLEIINSINIKLAFKLREASQEEINKIVEAIASINLETANLLYLEAKNRCKINPSHKKVEDYFNDCFDDCYQSKNEFKVYVDSIWIVFVKIVNNIINNMIDEINKFNAINGGEQVDEETRFFSLRATIDNINKNNIIDAILDSESKSKELYIDDMALITYMDENMFSKDTGFYTVFSENGKEYHQVTIYDTMGLFHDPSADIDDEFERVVETNRNCHNRNLIFIIDAMLPNDSKNSLIVINRLLETSPKELHIHIVYTHFDELVYKNILVNPVMPKNVDKCEAIKQAEDKISKIYLSSVESLSRNSKKKKPVLSHKYYVCGAPVEGKDEYLYINSSTKLLETISSSFNNCKYKVATIDFNKTIPISNNISRVNTYRIDKLFDNLIKCMWFTTASDFNIMWATVKAILTKWLNSGYEHISKAQGKETVYNYAKVDSLFVKEMRYFIDDSVKKNLVINTTDWLIAGDNDKFVDEARDRICEYLKYEFPKAIANEIYGSMSLNVSMGKILLNQILQELELNYFTDHSITINNNIYNCINIALIKSVEQFIDKDCIEVY